MDGELLDIKTGADEAAPFGSAQQLERKQREAPGTFFEMGSRGDAICLTTTPLHRECGRTKLASKTTPIPSSRPCQAAPSRLPRPQGAATS